MKKLLILQSSLPDGTITALVQTAGLVEWVPFVSDYERVKRLEEALRGVARPRDISRDLQDAAGRLRRPFYEATARLGTKYNSLAWWASDISERNTMKSSLFLECCYSLLAFERMGEDEDLCFIADSVDVIGTIRALAEKRGISVTARFSSSLKGRPLWAFAHGVHRLFLYLAVLTLVRLNACYHRYVTKRGRPLSNPDVILHTWVDEKCFGPNNTFRDRYFTILPEYYRKNGVPSATFVTLSHHNITRSLWRALSFLHTNQEDFIIPEDYLRPDDYLFPFRLWFAGLRYAIPSIVLEGVDCSLLFERHHRREDVHFETVYYLLFKRLAERGVRPKVVIDVFENMITDKLVQLGVRAFMPGTLVYGFFHVAPPPQVLCFFTDRGERDIAPLPDKIICNGPRYKDILAAEHYPRERIVVGAALRYVYLHSLKKAAAPSRAEFRVLLVLPIEKDAALELYAKLREAVADINHYRMILKPHPMETAIIERIRVSFLPGTEVVTGGMEEALAMCDVVVSAATGGVIDCVMADKEVIRVGRSTQIDLDPLAWFEEFGSPVLTSEELRERLLATEKRMKTASYKPPGYSALLPELFTPITDVALAEFMPPHPETAKEPIPASTRRQ